MFTLYIDFFTTFSLAIVLDDIMHKKRHHP